MPSVRSVSTDARISRTASTSASSSVVIAVVTASSPSRSLESRFSPTWVTDSSVPNPRKPEVPLIVWIVRKIRDDVHVRVLLECDESLIELVEVLVALGDELVDDLVELAVLHRQPPR